ncbi:MAG: 50S ribosomal protein L6 [Chloroflexi bacterium]|nr:50S ribosomal protein L6 [Chloroflexota bacterium]
MSRVGQLPIEVPAGVEIKIDGSYVHVKGPKGELEWTFSPDMVIKKENGAILVERPSDQPTHRSLHGTTRSVLNNMVLGVSQGFERILVIEGVGYRAELDGDKLVLNVGYSHPVVIEAPEGVSFEVDTRARQIKVLGYDKQVVGQIAANIRKVRPTEPYKGKGIRYQGEHIRRKAGKAGKAA